RSSSRHLRTLAATRTTSRNSFSPDPPQPTPPKPPTIPPPFPCAPAWPPQKPGSAADRVASAPLQLPARSHMLLSPVPEFAARPAPSNPGWKSPGRGAEPPPPPGIHKGAARSPRDSVENTRAGSSSNQCCRFASAPALPRDYRWKESALHPPPDVRPAAAAHPADATPRSPAALALR